MTILNTIQNKSLVSRHDQLAVDESFTIDNGIHASGEKLERGTLFGKLGSGKYRAYAEGVVTGAFTTGAKTFTLDPTSPATKHFRVGDVIEGTDSTALGTIATFDPATGIGTLVSNSTSNFSADPAHSVRIPLATVALASSAGKLLKDEVEMEDEDEPGVGYFEGFFTQSMTTLTTASIAAMTAVVVDTDEVRIK